MNWKHVPLQCISIFVVGILVLSNTATNTYKLYMVAVIILRDNELSQQTNKSGGSYNETTWGSNAEYTIVEENVQTNLVRRRNAAQFTTASNIPLSSQNQRLPKSSNETQ